MTEFNNSKPEISNAKNLTNLEDLTKFCNHKGFVYQGSEIYGGLANTWDYGPLGVELKNNIKQAWWKFFVHKRDDVVGLDASILMNPKVWEASGHVASFSDPLVDSKSSKKRYRADKLIEEFGDERPNNWAGEKTPAEDLYNFLMEKGVPDPETGETGCWTVPRKFNLMFQTHQGVVEDSSSVVYLRPETAQGIFVDFKNVQRTTRKKLPFGIAQIGKAFRNEITPGNFTFRTREFEQMEIEYFFDANKTPWEKLFESWKKDSGEFVVSVLGVNKDMIRFRDHDKDELSHYSKGTTDIEYKFPFGWGELCAAGAYRTDFDLTQHQNYSGQNLEYRDEEGGQTFIPHVIEPSFGADRLTLAVLIDNYKEQTLENGETRVLMTFPFELAPFKASVLPLMKKDGLAKKAKETVEYLGDLGFYADYDEAGSIGKRYRRQDENGTPWCITVDYQTKEDNTVTLRHRDTMEQVGENGRVKIEDLVKYFNKQAFGR